MAGALASRSSDALWPGRSMVPWARARSWPAARLRSVRSALRGAGDGGVQGERAQVRQGGQAGHQAAGRLGRVQHRADRGGIQVCVQAVGARAVQPVDRQPGARVVQRRNLRRAGQMQGGRVAGDSGAEGQPRHVEGVQIHVHRQGEAAFGGRRGLGGRGYGQALQIHAGGAQAGDVCRAAEQRQRRPVERHVVQGQPGAPRVAHFQMRQAQRVREAAGQPAQRHQAARQAGRLALDQALSGAGVGQRQHGGHQHDGQQHQHAGDPEQGLAHAVAARLDLAQNACPNPRYSS